MYQLTKARKTHANLLATVNEARALRVTELMRDYQNIQRRISQIQASPHSDEYHEVGYTTLRQCHAEARVLLNTPYLPEMLHPPTGQNEAEKRQLQRFVDLHKISRKATKSGVLV